MYEVIEKLTDPAVQRQLIFLKIISFLLSVFFIGMIIYTNRKTSWLRVDRWKQLQRFKNMKPYEVTMYSKRWQGIKKQLQSGSKIEAKLAIIEADELLSDVLETKAYRGDTIEERLERVKVSEVGNIEELKSIRELKESIVDNPDMDVPLSEAHRNIETYEKAFISLSIIEG